ncbi:MAG: hypothetical protein ACJA2Z_000393 [Candidatus Paceibacteria bacterium]|jgi:hypothetical protein
MNNMRKLGQGWQVTVHEYTDTVVYKKPHTSFFVAAKSILKDYPSIVLKPHKLLKFVKNLRAQQLNSLTQISLRHDISTHLGDPVIEKSGTYYQNKVIPMNQYIKGISKNDFETLVVDYADFVKYLSREGVLDKSCNFLKNFGINNNGDPVLIDLGELYFDAQEIREQIKRKPWARPQFLLPLSDWQREEFLKVMEVRFTVQ